MQPARKLRKQHWAFLVVCLLGLREAHGQKLYWVTPDARSIWRANMDGSYLEQIYRQEFDGSVRIALHEGGDKLYWTDLYAIYRANKDGSQVQRIVSSTNPIADLVIDPPGQKIYWIANGTQATNGVFRANLDGSNVERVLGFGTGNGYALALDPTAGKLYRSSGVGPGLNRIIRSNLDGTGSESVVIGTFQDIRGIAVDPAGGKLYWCDAMDLIVERADLDGSDEETIMYTGPDHPLAIAIAPEADRLFWSAGGLYGGSTRVERSTLNGQDRTTISTDADSVRGLAVDSAAQELYWTDQTRPAIQKTDFDGTHVVDVLTVPFVFVGPMAFDQRNNGLVWVDNGGFPPRMERGNANGSAITELLSNGLDFPLDGIAVDALTSEILWTEFGLGTIGRVDADGTKPETVVKGLDRPTPLAWDESTRTVYWADVCSTCQLYETVRLAGRTLGLEDPFTVVDTTGTVADLVVDSSEQLLLWTDDVLGKILRVSLKAPAEPQLVFDAEAPYAFTGLALDRTNHKLYWSLASNASVYRANVDGSQMEPVIAALEPPGWLRAIDPRVPGDVDHSGAVDLADFAAFQRCPHAQWKSELDSGCTFFDSDPADLDVDLADFLSFHSKFVED